MKLQRALRSIVQMGTVIATLRLQYSLPTTQEVRLDINRLKRSVTKTTFYPHDEQFVSEFRNNRSRNWTEGKAMVRVVDADCVTVAQKLIELHPNHAKTPAVLVFASKTMPGGGYKKGTGNQEEEICRRSWLWNNLDDPYSFDANRAWSYPIPEFGGIYSPDVAVFRKSENEGYMFMEEPLYLNFINVSPYSNIQINDVNHYGRREMRIADETARNYMRKMEVILNIARAQGHKSVVLGRFGCVGSTCKAARHLAEMWKEVIEKSPYAYREFFDDIVFAVEDLLDEKEVPTPSGRHVSVATAFGDMFGVEIENIDFF
ncbi:hypothetical protein AX774_g3995 [Zancudomyces culisetae]|uniref:Microbial-type PARG catalytic domain-containing protein n=1 Tax=Zancudomyces culisetae TaxID=1213189 RepID=A0A1R1PNI3_ZANCU|nr:hypothetical protein AX774_g3995 [Zancudomyces culisetae]|eukprot:OMH82514.1 hypothetical protein AX774_g3995 [Zancudomyces culisetae]